MRSVIFLTLMFMALSVSADKVRFGLGYFFISGTVVLDERPMQWSDSSNSGINLDIPSECFKAPGITAINGGHPKSAEQIRNAIGNYTIRNTSIKIECGARQIILESGWLEYSTSGIEWKVLNSPSDAVLNSYFKSWAKHIFKDSKISNLVDIKSGGFALEGKKDHDKSLGFLFHDSTVFALLYPKSKIDQEVLMARLNKMGYKDTQEKRAGDLITAVAIHTVDHQYNMFTYFRKSIHDGKILRSELNKITLARINEEIRISERKLKKKYGDNWAEELAKKYLKK